MSSSDAYFVRPTIPARYLAELLARTGLDRARTLAAAGLPANATALRKFRVSVEQFERLYTVACKACDDEMFGLFASRVPRGTYAVAIRMATRSRDLAELIESATRFYALFDRGHRYWHVSRDRGRAVLRVTCRTAQQASSLFFVVASGSVRPLHGGRGRSAAGDAGVQRRATAAAPRSSSHECWGRAEGEAPRSGPPRSGPELMLDTATERPRTWPRRQAHDPCCTLPVGVRGSNPRIDP